MLVALTLASSFALADHVVASRRALVKLDPERESQTLIAIERGDALQLLSDEQTAGYYRVVAETGEQGWVYRTFVRRHQGDLDWFVAGGDVGIGGGSASPYAYSGLPRNDNPAVPVTVLRKPYFVIGYSEDRRNPLWVCYAIGPAVDLTAYATRRFGVDDDTRARVSHDDYTNSGYSRGHMAPRMAISSRFGKPGNDSTFVMTNVCPQYQQFNDGQWGDLEEMIAGRKSGGGRFEEGWADTLETVWVTVGPIFDDDRSPLDSGVEVPNAFYCIVVDEEGEEVRALAFIMDHEDLREGEPLAALRSIDEIEERTRLDFFTFLPDDVETTLERQAATALWP
ncbi:MAG: DNA/RNA non-specific endonuclease [Phycisphaerales bacterium]|nr:DNA/RNA non-specific endonuclease [Phycisphaerales bacterium]